jgi:hypothetical protein
MTQLLLHSLASLEGVVYFDHRQVDLIVVCNARGRDIVEEDEGVERLTNTLPKTSSDARRSAGILDLDHPVVNRNRVCATVALPGIVALAWLPCLGTGTVA